MSLFMFLSSLPISALRNQWHIFVEEVKIESPFMVSRLFSAFL